MVGEHLGARIDESALERLRIAAQGSIWFALSALVFNLCIHPHSSPALHFGIACAALASFAIFHAVRRNKVPQRAVSATGTFMMAYGVGLCAWGTAVLRSADFTAIACVLMLAAGLLHLYRRWVLVNLLMSLAVLGCVGFTTMGRDFAIHMTALVFSALLAEMFHEVGTSYMIKLEELRIRDRDHDHERQQLREQLWHSQKLESIGTLAGGVAHDMNNVFGVILALAELIREDVSGRTRADIEQLLEAVHRGSTLTRNLLGFSRRGTYHKEPLEAAALVDSVVKLLVRTIGKGITLQSLGTSALAIEGDAAQLSHALMNLCLNAADAMQGNGQLSIRIAEAQVSAHQATGLDVIAGSFVTVSVSDTGTGMTSEVQSRIFEPFFTTKPLGAGTGLGLPMVYGTIKSHGGGVRVESEVGRGTTVTLFLPSTTLVPSRVALPSNPPLCRGMILVVDDEEQLRNATSRSLTRAGFEVCGAADGREGFEAYRTRKSKIDLVILDMAMPVMGGAECFAKLRALDPTVAIILVSGFAVEVEAQTCLDQGAVAFLEKPFRAREIVKLVSSVLETRSSGAPAAYG